MARLNNGFLLLFLICGLIIAHSAFAAPNINHDKIRLQSLNKATAETSTFEVDVGDTIKLGPLYIRPQACRTNPPTEEPESAGFIQIWTIKDPESEEEGKKPKSEWVFSGWMFASSPGLSSMDHSVYDLWVIDCGKETVGGNVVAASIEESESDEMQEMDEAIIIEDEDGEAPIVKLDGQEIYVPEAEPDVMEMGEDQQGVSQASDLEIIEEEPDLEEEVLGDEDDARFEAYEEESAPTVRLE